MLQLDYQSDIAVRWPRERLNGTNDFIDRPVVSFSTSALTLSHSSSTRDANRHCHCVRSLKGASSPWKNLVENFGWELEGEGGWRESTFMYFRTILIDVSCARESSREIRRMRNARDSLSLSLSLRNKSAEQDSTNETDDQRRSQVSSDLRILPWLQTFTGLG